MKTFCRLLLIFSTFSCSFKESPTAALQRKYPAEALRRDFSFMKEILQKFHPSLYWYTPKDSLEQVFRQMEATISDSMTQQEFGFRVLAPALSAIRCGHTSFSYSVAVSAWNQKHPHKPSFPLHLKVWGDTMVVTTNLNRQDSAIKKGALIHSINGLNPFSLKQWLYRYMPTDGYSQESNDVRLSSSFPYYADLILGTRKSYDLVVENPGLPLQNIQVAGITSRAPSDSGKILPKKEEKRENFKDKRKRSMRALSFPMEGTALMEINSFEGRLGLHRFFSRSFQKIHQDSIKDLIIDIRVNGGGKVNHYTDLARYLRKTPFLVADSAYAIRRSFGNYRKYFSERTIIAVALQTLTRKKEGRFHFRYWERHRFKPRTRRFFEGNIYLITSGPTYSAASLFAHTLSRQANVQLIGEETGGGQYGNSGLMIPMVTLPDTKMRIRLPLFRLVSYEHPENKGRGVIPDFPVGPTVSAVRSRTDLKMEKTMELIRTRRKSEKHERIAIPEKR